MDEKMIGNTLVIVYSILIYSGICMILGAPIMSEILETLSVGCALTMFTTVPFLMFDKVTIERVNTVYFCPKSPHEKFLAFIGYGSLIGSWASAALLILDWERPWQVWPLPCVTGAVVGAIVGVLIFMAISSARGWDIQCSSFLPCDVKDSRLASYWRSDKSKAAHE